LSAVIVACALGVVFVKSIGTGSADVSVQGGSVFDSGNIQPPGPACHDYVLLNPHSYRVHAEISSVGCECTHAGISSNTISPFGKASVHVSVDLEDSTVISSGVCVTTTHTGHKTDTWLMMTGKVARPVRIRGK